LRGGIESQLSLTNEAADVHRQLGFDNNRSQSKQTLVALLLMYQGHYGVRDAVVVDDGGDGDDDVGPLSPCLAYVINVVNKRSTKKKNEI
jgi:hypothetical protein